MDKDDVAGRLSSYPPGRPKRRFTASDIGLMAGTGLLMTVGSLAAAVGNLSGMVFAVVAAAGVILVRTSRSGRVNEPAQERVTVHLATAVSVFVMVYTFGMWRNSPIDTTPALLLSLVPPGVYAVYLAILFRRRGNSHG